VKIVTAYLPAWRAVVGSAGAGPAGRPVRWVPVYRVASAPGRLLGAPVRWYMWVVCGRSGRCRWYPGVSLDEAGQGVEEVVAVLCGGGQVAAQRGEVLGAFHGAQAAGYLRLQFRGADVAFGLVVVVIRISA
jgi:hypothetical protein